MFADLYPGETERALRERASAPAPVAPQKSSAWASAAQLVTAPLTGAAQAVNETLRVASRAAGSLVRGDDMDGRVTGLLDAVDEQLRSGADYWKPDPAVATWAGNFIHEGSRILTKVAGYSLAGGLPGTVLGTAVDEGATTYLSLRDQGVDSATASKVGAVRGAATALSVAIPAAGATIPQTAALVVASGPGAFIAENVLTRQILERANYWELGSQYDPTDAAGLAASLIPGAAVGVAIHAARGRSAKAGAGMGKPDPVAAMAQDPDTVDAAHVLYRQHVAEAGSLADRADPSARVRHQQALAEMHQALEEGRPAILPDLPIDEARGAAVFEEMRRRQTEQMPPAFTREEVDAAARRVDPNLLDEIKAARALAEEFGGKRFEGADQVDPVVRNLAIGLHEAGSDIARAYRVMSRYADATSRPDPMGRAPADIAADVVQFERDRRYVAQEIGKDEFEPAQRVRKVVAQLPDMPVRLEDPNAAPMRAADVFERASVQAKLEAREQRRIFTAAIECAIRFGD